MPVGKPVAKVRALTKAQNVAAEKIARKVTRSAREPEAAGIGIAARVGRKRADGSRTGAREVRRMTFYLPRAIAKELTTRAADREMHLSDLAAEVFAAAFGVKL